jgi:hypothetical protein
MVEPGQWVSRAFKLGKFQLVGRGKENTAQVLIIFSLVAVTRRTAGVLHLTLDALEGKVERNMLLALVADHVL